MLGNELLSHGCQLILTRYKDLLNDEALRKLFYALLEQNYKSTYSLHELVKISNAAKIAKYFAETRTRNQESVIAIADVIATNEGQAAVQSFLAQAQMPSFGLELETSKFCHCAYQEAYLQLYSSIRVILLSSAILAPREGQKGFRSDLISLLEPQQNFTQRSCLERVAHARSSPVSILKETSTPRSISISHTWRENLKQEMLQDALHRSASIIRMVGGVCRDLELRCEDTERPLREEQTKVRELEANLQQCKVINHKTGEEIESAQLRVESLRDEKDNFQQQLRSSEHNLQSANCKYELLYEEFENSKAAAQHATAIVAESGRQQDLAYLAILTGKNELIEVQSSKLAANVQQIQVLEETLAQCRSQQARMAEDIQSDGKIIEDLKETKSELSELLNTKEANIQLLTTSETRLLANVDSLSRQVTEINSKSDDTIAGLTSRMLAAETANGQLRNEHEREMAEKEAASLSCAQRTQSDISRLQNELYETRRNAVHSAATRDSFIIKLESEILVLHQERQAQAREFAEAQELSSRLVAIVGKKQVNPLTLKTKSRIGADENESLSPEDSPGNFQREKEPYPGVLSKFDCDFDQQRLKRRCKTRSPPTPSVDVSSASNLLETRRRSAPVWTNREPLKALSESAPNRGRPSKVSPVRSSPSKIVDENARSNKNSDGSVPDAVNCGSPKACEKLVVQAENVLVTAGETVAEI